MKTPSVADGSVEVPESGLVLLLGVKRDGAKDGDGGVSIAAGDGCRFTCRGPWPTDVIMLPSLCTLSPVASRE